MDFSFNPITETKKWMYRASLYKNLLLKIKAEVSDPGSRPPHQGMRRDIYYWIKEALEKGGEKF